MVILKAPRQPNCIRGEYRCDLRRPAESMIQMNKENGGGGKRDGSGDSGSGSGSGSGSDSDPLMCLLFELNARFFFLGPSIHILLFFPSLPFLHSIRIVVLVIPFMNPLLQCYPPATTFFKRTRPRTRGLTPYGYVVTIFIESNKRRHVHSRKLSSKCRHFVNGVCFKKIQISYLQINVERFQQC